MRQDRHFRSHGRSQRERTHFDTRNHGTDAQAATQERPDCGVAVSRAFLPDCGATKHHLDALAESVYGGLMKLVRRVRSWLIKRIPERYRGNALDRFGPKEQQDIMANRFRSGM